MKGAAVWARLAAAAAMLWSFAAGAVTISGSMTTVGYANGSTQVNYTCDGAPTCTGTYTATLHDNGCNQTITFSGAITITGMNPAQANLSGNFTLANFTVFTSSCPATTTFTQSGTYAATSDGTVGTMTGQVHDTMGTTITLQGNFSVGAPSNVRVSGGFALDMPPDFFHVSFTCTGMPSCAGAAQITERDSGCSNSFSWTQTFVINGLDLSRPGSFSGTRVGYGDSSSNINSDGTCTYRVKDNNPRTSSYTGTWDGTNGTLNFTFTDDHGNTIPITATFTAAGIAPPPAFPMPVTANITPTTANATAIVQPRPQDVGTTQSIFVFAYAPQSIVLGNGKRIPTGRPLPAELQDGDPCVLAQLNPSGQLTGATASTLSPTVTTTLNAQGSAVNILTNVSTPNVAGATFYVGYGTTSTTMFSGGNYQGAVNIPGSSQCTTNLAATAAPALPGALTGLWWNANESGWGIHFTQRGNNIFAAWYTYDGTGKPKWYVSTCNGFTGASGTCSGTLYEVTGPSFFGATFNSSLVNAVNAGNLQLTFTNPNSASMTYTANGQTRSNIALTRQPLATGTTPPAVDFSDIWWAGASESGWGIAMAEQYGTMFLAWYVYDSNGKPTWLVATCSMSGTSCSGTLYRTTGPAFGPTFDSSRVTATAAGTISVNFTDANNATLNYTVDGVSGTKHVTRQVF